ncbi:ABC transporter permease [Betaproteobacteria bacterium]|nr:ABC transporter permease [Betaproteobacteria bacterium]
MNAAATAASITLLDSGDAPRLCVGGAWTLAHYRALGERIAPLRQRVQAAAGLELDLSALTALDTAGAQLLGELIGVERLREQLTHPALSHAQRVLLATVADALVAPHPPPAPRQYGLADVFAHIGEAAIHFWQHLVTLLAFIGVTLEGLVLTLLRPWCWRVTPVVANLEQTGFDAIPIVALLTFLVGAVVAFLGATVLSNFGATIYTVSLVGFAFVREFGVLLAAILVAGRTASAFAAQIGSMRANEEIDAIEVLGLNPIELLVLPRVLALMIALPALTVVATLSGIAGGLVVCAFSLDIGPELFLTELNHAIAPRHFYVGILKAPIFAFLIAVIGCLEGFQVRGSAQSVGEHTTSAVVQSIFTVIVVDAIAAIFCMEMGW